MVSKIEFSLTVSWKELHSLTVMKNQGSLKTWSLKNVRFKYYEKLEKEEFKEWVTQK